MTGLHARLGWPIWLCRFVVEGTVLLTGWLLGGTVGLGTVLFATLIGPAVHLAMDLSARWETRRAAYYDTKRQGLFWQLFDDYAEGRG